MEHRDYEHPHNRLVREEVERDEIRRTNETRKNIPMVAEFTPDEIAAAHNDGATAAERLTIGSVFTGAFGAFARTTHDPALRSIFTHGYLWKLRRPVVTDFDNRITSLGPPK